jgi:hypothetical protein
LASNTVDEAASLIRNRLKELDAERAQLERALSSLTGGREGRRGPGRPRSSARGGGAGRGRRPGRRRATRADQAVKLIQENPGIGASDVARRMKIKPNYLYRVLGDLQKEGRVKKSGRAYTAA